MFFRTLTVSLISVFICTLVFGTGVVFGEPAGSPPGSNITPTFSSINVVDDATFGGDLGVTGNLNASGDLHANAGYLNGLIVEEGIVHAKILSGEDLAVVNTITANLVNTGELGTALIHANSSGSLTIQDVSDLDVSGTVTAGIVNSGDIRATTLNSNTVSTGVITGPAAGLAIQNLVSIAIKDQGDLTLEGSLNISKTLQAIKLVANQVSSNTGLFTIYDDVLAKSDLTVEGTFKPNTVDTGALVNTREDGDGELPVLVSDDLEVTGSFRPEIVDVFTILNSRDSGSGAVSLDDDLEITGALSNPSTESFSTGGISGELPVSLTINDSLQVENSLTVEDTVNAKGGLRSANGTEVKDGLDVEDGTTTDVLDVQEYIWNSAYALMPSGKEGPAPVFVQDDLDVSGVTNVHDDILNPDVTSSNESLPVVVNDELQVFGGLDLMGSNLRLLDEGFLYLFGGNLTLGSGDLQVSTGDITMPSGGIFRLGVVGGTGGGDAELYGGSVRLTSGDFASNSGNLTLTNGDINMTAGDLNVTQGVIHANQIGDYYRKNGSYVSVPAYSARTSSASCQGEVDGLGGDRVVNCGYNFGKPCPSSSTWCFNVPVWSNYESTLVTQRVDTDKWVGTCYVTAYNPSALTDQSVRATATCMSPDSEHPVTQ